MSGMLSKMLDVVVVYCKGVSQFQSAGEVPRWSPRHGTAGFLSGLYI